MTAVLAELLGRGNGLTGGKGGSMHASMAADECFWDLDGPLQRINTPHIPLPAADSLEDLQAGEILPRP
jgi:pyruvate/2-oxoglutarate/acetoin dehydrogenase E1 component